MARRGLFGNLLTVTTAAAAVAGICYLFKEEIRGTEAYQKVNDKYDVDTKIKDYSTKAKDKAYDLKDKAKVEKEIGFEIKNEEDVKTILVTYHPVTLSSANVGEDIDALLSALAENKALRIIFTMPNSDNGSHIIAEKINSFVAQNKDRAIAYTSLGVRRYLSVMQYCAAVVGNSSSGIVETPSFHIPTLNIGSRQAGRIAAESVYNCATDKTSISAGLAHVLSSEFRAVAAKAKNPYEKVGTAHAIFDVISTYPLDGIIKKKFYDL